MDIPVYGNGGLGPPRDATKAVQAPAYQLKANEQVEIAPNPNNASDFYITEGNPGGLVAGPYRVIKASANPITLRVSNLAQIFALGAAGDFVLITVKQR